MHLVHRPHPRAGRLGRWRPPSHRLPDSLLDRSAVGRAPQWTDVAADGGPAATGRLRSTRPVEPVDRLDPSGVLPADLRRDLARHVDVVRPAAGSRLARAGGQAREVAVVVRGEVVVRDDRGERGRLGPGESFGGHEVRSGATHRHDHVAGADLELVVVPAPAFRAVSGELGWLAAPSEPPAVRRAG